MRTRTLRIVLLGFFGLWFGAILPGHERGAVPVPGAAARTGDHHACAAHPVSHCHRGGHGAPATPGEPAEPAPPVSDCAVCHLIGTLQAPPAIDLTPQQPRLIALLPWPAAVTATPEPAIATSFCRGPPARA